MNLHRYKQTPGHSHLSVSYSHSGEKSGYNIISVVRYYHCLSTSVKVCASLKGEMKQATFPTYTKVTHRLLDMKQTTTTKVKQQTGKYCHCGVLFYQSLDLGKGKRVNGGET